MTTGTDISTEILELYKKFGDRVDFKNVQRRVYDTLNVLSAMKVIKKHKNHLEYNEDNEFINDEVIPNTVPQKIKQAHNYYLNHAKIDMHAPKPQRNGIQIQISDKLNVQNQKS